MGAKKGQFNVVELVISIVIVLLSLYVFFPETIRFGSSWELILPNIFYYDLFESLGNAKLLDYFVFNQSFRIEINPITLNTNYLSNRIEIACNCSDKTISILSDRFSVNNFYIDNIVCLTNLESLNPCIGNSKILVLDKLPSSSYYNFLKNLLDKGYSILLYADLSNENLNNNQIATNIFGLKNSSKNFLISNVTFRLAPLPDLDNETYKNYYGIYKNYYGISLRVYANETSLRSECQNYYEGKIYIFNSTYSHNFYICNSSTVIVDLNRNGIYDSNEYKKVNDKLDFLGFKTNVTLKKIEKNFIEIKFDKYNLEFSDITNFAVIQPEDNNNNRTVLNRSNIENAAALITNTTSGKVAWLSNFNNDFSHDKLSVLFSTILWLSFKNYYFSGNLKYMAFSLNETFLVYEIVV